MDDQETVYLRYPHAEAREEPSIFEHGRLCPFRQDIGLYLPALNSTKPCWDAATRRQMRGQMRLARRSRCGRPCCARIKSPSDDPRRKRPKAQKITRNVRRGTDGPWEIAYAGGQWSDVGPCLSVRSCTRHDAGNVSASVQQASRQCGHMPDPPGVQAVSHMIIPTEPIGSIPRPLRLIEAIAEVGGDDPSVAASLR